MKIKRPRTKFRLTRHKVFMHKPSAQLITASLDWSGNWFYKGANLGECDSSLFTCLGDL